MPSLRTPQCPGPASRPPRGAWLPGNRRDRWPAASARPGRLLAGALAAVAALCAGCGSSPGFTSGSAPQSPAPARTAKAPAAPARPATDPASPTADRSDPAACQRLVSQWRRSPAARSFRHARGLMPRAAAAERAQEYPAAVADLDLLGGLVAAMRHHPLPPCAAGYRYWRGMLRRTRAAVSLAVLVGEASPQALQRSGADLARARHDGRAVTRTLRRHPPPPAG